MRLIGVVRASLPGMTITPSAAQGNSFTVVVAHLALPLSGPRGDVNTPHAATGRPLVDPEAPPASPLPLPLPLLPTP